MDPLMEKRHAFYNQINEGDKAEFINGEIIFHSPVKLRHNAILRRLLILITSYVQGLDLGFVGLEKIMISLTRNDYEPDICFFNKETSEQFSPDQMRFPAPDFVVEVLSQSTAKHDRGVKFDDYAAHGIEEYWIIDPVSEMVEQYRLQNDSYTLIIKAKTGQLASVAMSDFVIPIRAIFDEAENRTALRQILSE
jgi:Uma2 family endonuclease